MDQDWNEASPREQGTSAEPHEPHERHEPAREQDERSRIMGGSSRASWEMAIREKEERYRALLEQVEETSRASKERQAFLLELSDALRPLVDPIVIQATACQLLLEHLRVDRVAYAEVAEDGETVAILRDHTSPGTPSAAGEYLLREFPSFETLLREGKPATIEDAAADQRVGEPEYRQHWQRSGVRAAIIYPLVKLGRLVAIFFAHDNAPHAWSEGDASLVAEVGERTWEAVERARAEASLRAHEERYRRLLYDMVERCPFGIYIVDSSFRIATMNLGSLEGAFANVRPIIGRPLTEAMHVLWPHDVAEGVISAFRHTLETGEPYHSSDFVNRRADIGQTVGYEWKLQRIELPDGRYGVACYFFDSTELRRAERQLRNSESRLTAVLEQLPVAVGVMDMNGHWLRSNPMMDLHLPEAIPSVRPEGLKRWRAWDEHGLPLKPENWPGQRALRGETVAPGIEVLHTLDDGREVWMRVSAAPLRDEDGTIIGATAVVQDVDAIKRAQEALREADRRKDEFLSTLSHELRNPLAPIRNSLYLLRSANHDRDLMKRLLEMMERQVGHMVRLVDDLMEVSRITLGKLELRTETVDLAKVVRHAAETSRPLIEAGGHRFSISLPREPLVLEVDPVRLEQVIANLLNNAAKYSEARGHIWLTLRREGDEAVVSVRDHGIGIPRDMLSKIFDLFAQGDRGYSRSGGGLGVGLTLVRRLVEMHGGSVQAKSDGPGKGSEFVVRIPVTERRHPRHATEPRKAPHLRIPHHRIMVVDDNRDAADSLGMLLRRLGADVATFTDGRSAIDALASYRPSVILLDIGMPGMDGYEFARRARERLEGREPAFIALSGWGQEADRLRSRAAGIAHHLVKPADLTALQSLLASLPDRPRSHATGA